MCFTWCPPLSPEQCQEVRCGLSQQGIHERAYLDDRRHINSFPATLTTPITTEQEFGNLESPAMVQFPSTVFYFFPERGILLIDESDTLYQWDGIFIRYVPSTHWKDYSHLQMIMALDPFCDSSNQHFPLPDPKAESDAWMRIMKQFSANLYLMMKGLSNLEEVILLSSDQKGYEFVVHVKEYIKRPAFPVVEHVGVG